MKIPKSRKSTSVSDLLPLHFDADPLPGIRFRIRIRNRSEKYFFSVKGIKLIKMFFM